MANQIALPNADDTDGSWTDKDGGTTLYTSIDEASADNATTFIKSTDNGSDDACIVQLASISAPASGNVRIKYTAMSVDESGFGSTPGIKFELLEEVEGSDIVRGAAQTNNSVHGSSWTAYNYPTSGSLDVSSVSNWGNLKLRITMLTNGGTMMDVLKVTQAYLETPEAGGASVPIAAIAMNTYRQMRN